MVDSLRAYQGALNQTPQVFRRTHRCSEHAIRTAICDLIMSVRFWPKAIAAFVIAEGFVLGLESTKVIKKQIAESLYVAYDDAASYLAIESKG